MVLWTNHVTIAGPRNGTTDHTVDPSAGTVVAGAAFTPTAGRLLVCIASGPVTSTTPAGWTLPANGSAVNNIGLYVWTKAAAGSDTLTTTHNGSNSTVAFDFYEFAATSTFLGSASAISVPNGDAGPTLSGLTADPKMYLAAAGQYNIGTGTISYTWSGGVEAVDVSAPASGTDGYVLGVAYLEDSTLTSASLAATAAGGQASSERLMFAVNAVAASGTNGSVAAVVATATAAARVPAVGASTGLTIFATRNQTGV